MPRNTNNELLQPPKYKESPMKIMTTMSAPIKCPPSSWQSSHTYLDEDDYSISEYFRDTEYYDSMTWAMYHRITNARRSCSSSSSFPPSKSSRHKTNCHMTTTTSSSTTTTATATAERKNQLYQPIDSNHSTKLAPATLTSSSSSGLYHDSIINTACDLPSHVSSPATYNQEDIFPMEM